jgi:hypothetical protein
MRNVLWFSENIPDIILRDSFDYSQSLKNNHRCYSCYREYESYRALRTPFIEKKVMVGLRRRRPQKWLLAVKLQKLRNVSKKLPADTHISKKFERVSMQETLTACRMDKVQSEDNYID